MLYRFALVVTLEANVAARGVTMVGIKVEKTTVGHFIVKYFKLE